MRRISIDVTPEEHQRLKALAALQGKTIKEFVLSRTLGAAPPGSDEDNALGELEALLDERMKRAKKEGFSTRTVKQIFDDAIADAGRSPDV